MNIRLKKHIYPHMNTQKVISKINPRVSTERWPIITFPPINLWTMPRILINYKILSNETSK